MSAEVQDADEKVAVSPPPNAYGSMPIQPYQAAQDFPVGAAVQTLAQPLNFTGQDAGFQQMYGSQTPAQSPHNTQPSLQPFSPQTQQLPRPDLNTQRGSERVPIPPANTRGPTGPMSQSVALPTRAKPGRKPIATSESGDRRRIQNREAQRQFRDKRQQKLSDIMNELSDSKKSYEEHLGQTARQNDILKRQNDELVRERQRSTAVIAEQSQRIRQLERRIEQYENRNLRDSVQTLPSVGSMSAVQMQRRPQAQGPFRHGDPGAITPPETNFMEIDFTGLARSQTQQSSNTLAPTLTGGGTSVNFNPDPQTSDEQCGFCTDEQNCLCRQQQPAPSRVQPGNCEACRSDPVRAQACRRLADSADSADSAISSFRTFSSADMLMFDAGGQPLPGSGNLPDQTITCEQLMDRAEQSGRMAGITELFGNQIHAQANTANGRYEVSEREAAQALHTLSRRDTRAGPGSSQ